MNKTALLHIIWIPFFLSGCNLYGGLSKPSDDDQYLVAARSCLDHGDYECAKQNYQALSDNYLDVKTSEGSLTLLAEGNIFSISDLVNSLGSNLGDATSYSFLASALAARGVTDGTHRETIINAYNDDAAIVDVKLKAFSQFIAALAMFNEVLANAVGPDGQLTAADIVDSSHLAACRSTQGTTGQCVAPTGTALTYNVGDGTTFASSATAWNSPATIQKLVAAAAEASQDFTSFSGISSNSGIYTTIHTLATLPGTESLARYLVLTALDL